MELRRTFLIVGLPRSRTAWLAAFLTDGPVFCHHELIARCAGWDGYPDALMNTPAEIVGDSSSAIPAYYDKCAFLLPPHNVIFIDRDRDDATASAQRFVRKECGQLFDPIRHQKVLADYDAMRCRFPNSLTVPYQNLDDAGAVGELVQETTGQDLNIERFNLFTKLRITVIPQKAYAHVLKSEAQSILN